MDVNEFSFAENAWDEKILPIITRRVPQFATGRVTDSWMGGIMSSTRLIIMLWLGRMTRLRIGFSGHGSQQAPACGRGVAELIAYGGFKTLHLSELSYRRIAENRPLMERAVI